MRPFYDDRAALWRLQHYQPSPGRKINAPTLQTKPKSEGQGFSPANNRRAEGATALPKARLSSFVVVLVVVVVVVLVLVVVSLP